MVETEYTVHFKDTRTGKELDGMRFGSLGELFRFKSDRPELVQLRMYSRTYSRGEGHLYLV